MAAKRADGRKEDEMRPINIKAGVNPYAEGSAEISIGATRVLVTASIEKDLPAWMEPTGGWITAEYGMLPRSTHLRSEREARAGKQSGRTMEIQRLIGRSLRGALDLRMLPHVSIKLDCDVIVADGGTRTAAVSAGWVALYQALRWAKQHELLEGKIEMTRVAAVSAGIWQGQTLLDLTYEEDSSSEFDLNLVFNDRGEIIEVQGTAEHAPIAPEKLQQLVELGFRGVNRIMEEQQKCVESMR